MIDTNGYIIDSNGDISLVKNPDLKIGYTLDGNWEIIDKNGNKIDKVVFKSSNKSKFGHMWYSLSNDHAYGFSPIEDGSPIGGKSSVLRTSE